MILPIKKKWFDMIKSGVKKEEYREIKPYYDVRFANLFKNDNRAVVTFRNGYSNNSPQIDALVELHEGYGKPEWGANENNIYYILKILMIYEIKGEKYEC